MNKIKIIIADDHNFYRSGLRSFLDSQPFIEVVGEASNGYSLLSLVEELKPDIVLTDLRMPELNGIEFLKKIKTSGCTAKCIVFSYFDSDSQILESLTAGALGYITKGVDDDDFIIAIKSVYEGNTYFSESVVSKLAVLMGRGGKYARSNPYKEISNTQKKIVDLICKGRTNKQIAAEIYLSHRTVETARARLFRKLGIKTTADLIIWAIQNGIYEP